MFIVVQASHKKSILKIHFEINHVMCILDYVTTEPINWQLASNIILIEQRKCLVNGFHERFPDH